MRTLKYLILLLPVLSLAQVGVNTTTPNGALDIQSTNNGVLIPRVQLTDALDVTNVVNPAGGALSTSTLIYNLVAAGVPPNNVVSGFYYWNGARWIAMNSSADHDWYEEGTTTPPDAITDGMFHTGNVAIGKNIANTTLDLETTNENVGIKNTLIKNSATGDNYNIDNDININSTDFSFGLRNHFFGTGTGDKVGVTNLSDSGILGSKTGVTNDFMGYNGDEIKGITSTMTHNDNGNTYGVFNTLNNLPGSSGLTYGLYNSFNNNSSALAIGVNNEISAPSGNGGIIGVRNLISGGKAGGKIGISNTITSTIPDTLIGITNTLTSTVGTGSLTGMQNNLTPNSDALTIGNANQIGGTGNSNVSAVYSFITNSGDGEHTGIFSNLSGGGTGRKYGTSSIIETTAGGQHFGVFARVLKPGNNYAGYFNGKVAIGSNISFGIDDYVFPPSRGTNEQIMQTDGSGNITWRNPNFWFLNGNAVTNPPAVIGTPIATNENFIGTTDYQNLVFGTNNTSRMNITAFGNVGIGVDNPFAKFQILENAGPGAVTTYIRQNCSGSIGGNTALVVNSISTSANKVNYAAEFSATGSNLQTNIAAKFSASGATDNYAIIVPANSGDVGFGTETPSTKLHVEKATSGAVRIVDGTQANGNVFRSDANGVGTWQNPNTFSWSLTGNSVNAATQFLGSTNDADVVFKRNNARAGYIGQYNTALGINALPATTGVYNVAMGVNALASLGLADQNCAFGWNALSAVTTGGNNIGIGTNAQVPIANGNNQVRIGNTNITYAGIQVAWTVTSDKRWKDNIQSSNLGLDFINRLNPVSYTRKNDVSKKAEYGFIAQELDQTLNEFGATNSGIITKDDAGMLGVRYNDLLAPIVKAIQELKAENDALKAQNTALNNRLKAIENKQ